MLARRRAHSVDNNTLPICISNPYLKNRLSVLLYRAELPNFSLNVRLSRAGHCHQHLQSGFYRLGVGPSPTGRALEQQSWSGFYWLGSQNNSLFHLCQQQDPVLANWTAVRKKVGPVYTNILRWSFRPTVIRSVPHKSGKTFS